MTRVAAMCALHYGKEYLREVVAALDPFVGKFIVLYTPEPSYGHASALSCPDSEEELKACCLDNPKVQWHSGRWPNEAVHRAAVRPMIQDVDVVLVADSDEVWEPATVESAIKTAVDGDASHYGVDGFVHFWRSFHQCCRDVWRPVRVLCPKRAHKETDLSATIYHFGYAQSEAIVAYKMSCHGHKDEWRPEWWKDRFLADARIDLHPTVFNWWNAEAFDRTKLPELVRRHRYYDVELIR